MANFIASKKKKMEGAAKKFKKVKNKEVVESLGTGVHLDDYGMNLEDFVKVACLSKGLLASVNLVQHNSTQKYFVLKTMRKSDLAHLKQVSHACNERRILQAVSMPFVAKMYKSFQDERHVHMLLEFVSGGDLFTHMRRQASSDGPTTLGADVTRLVVAELVVALEQLHELDVVHRNICLENILLDRQGHIKLVGFSNAKTLDESKQAYTLCGHPEYMAPEIIRSQGHGKAADWWAVGILVYEMLAGFPPFVDDSPNRIYERILSERVRFPSWFDVDSRDFIKKLLVINPAQRLGANGADEIKTHNWFRGFLWTAVAERRADPLFVPPRPMNGAKNDLSNFDVVKDAQSDFTGAEVDPYGELFADF